MSNEYSIADIQKKNKFNRNIGATLSIVNMFTSIVLGFIYTPFVLKSLGQSEYGVYSLASSLVSYLLVLDLGFGATLVRYNSRAKAEGKEEKYINGLFLVFYCIIAVVALIIGILMSFNLNSFFSTSFTANESNILRKVYFVFLINTVIAFPASFFSAIIRTNEKFIFANVMTLIGNILRHILGACVLLLGYHSFAMAVTSLAVSIFAFLVNLYYCFGKLNLKIGLKYFDKNFYKEIFFFSFFVLINIIVDELYANTDNIILGKICGASAVSIYSIGVMFKGYFAKFSTAISSVFLPHISKLSVEKDSIKKMSDVFIRIGRIQLLLLSYILVGFISFGRNFIEFWVGKGYESSYFIALLIMIPAIVPLSQNIGISVLQALNKHKVRSIMYLTIAILNVVISIPLAYKFQGVGAALGTAIGNVLGQIIFMNWYYNKLGIDILKYWKLFIGLSIKEIPILIVFIVFNMLPIPNFIGLIIKILLSQILTLPYMYFFILNDSEKHLVKSLFSKFKIGKNNL